MNCDDELALRTVGKERAEGVMVTGEERTGDVLVTGEERVEDVLVTGEERTGDVLVTDGERAEDVLVTGEWVLGSVVDDNVSVVVGLCTEVPAPGLDSEVAHVVVQPTTELACCLTCT